MKKARKSSIPLSSLSLCGTAELLPSIESGWLINPDRRNIEHVVARMEFHWGLRSGQLDLRSPLNAFSARSDMLQLFRDEGWGILPILETFLKVVKWAHIQRSTPLGERTAFTKDFPPQDYEYILYPCKMELVPLYIHEENQPPLRVEPPYNDLPRITSSVHPFFAVYNGMNSLGVRPKYLPHLVHKYLVMVLSTWGVIPPPEFYHGLPWTPPKYRPHDYMEDLVHSDSDGSTTSFSSPQLSTLPSPQSAAGQISDPNSKFPDSFNQLSQLPDETSNKRESVDCWLRDQRSLN